MTARWSKMPFDKNSSGDEFFHKVNKIFGKIENTFLISSKNIDYKINLVIGHLFFMIGQQIANRKFMSRLTLILDF